MRSTPIGKLTEAVDTWNPSREPGGAFDYIDLSAIDGSTKKITAATRIPLSEAPSRARQLVAASDVLVSTVRPNLNAVAVVPPALHGATASTGFTVLRPSAELDSLYLFHWVRSPDFISEMTRNATGASYPAVSDRIVKGIQMPAPRLHEQRRIAAILDKADEIRTKRRQTLAHFDTLPEVMFRSMFGSLRATAEVTAVATSIRTGPFGSQLLHSEFVNDGVAVLGLDNVVGNEFRWAERRYITQEKYTKLRRYTVKSGDVLISIMGTTGRCVVVPVDIPTAINTKHICAITADAERVLPAFLRAAFLWHPDSRAHLRRQTKGSIMDGLNMGIIKAMPVPVPPLDRQREFAEQVAAIDVQRSAVERALAADDELFASLQSRAFRGEL